MGRAIRFVAFDVCELTEWGLKFAVDRIPQDKVW